MRNISILLSLLFVLSTCKKDEDTSVLVNASVANSSEGSVDFKSGDYSIGSSVTFSATPKTGYVFTNWTDTNSNQTYTSNPLSITVNENTTLVANFEKAAYNVMFTISGEGSVQKEVVGAGGFTHGSQVKLTATPSDNYSFFYWNNDAGDTENPKTITLDSNQNIPAKFDYEVARNLVGNWEFEISDPASKNITIIRMSIDIFLNVLMTTIVNGEVISQIFSQMVAISSTAIVIGDFAVITDVVVASATSLSMNMVSIPENTAPPTNQTEIPDTGSELNLSGNKSDEEPETDEDGIIIPPTDAVTASSTTQDIGAIFDESFDKLVNEAIETGTDSSTTDTVTNTIITGNGSFFENHAGKVFKIENGYATFINNNGNVGDIFYKYCNLGENGDSDIYSIGHNLRDKEFTCYSNFVEITEIGDNSLSIKVTFYEGDDDCDSLVNLSEPDYAAYTVNGNELTADYYDGTSSVAVLVDEAFPECITETGSNTGTSSSTSDTTTTTNTGTTSSTAPGGGGNSGTTSSSTNSQCILSLRNEIIDYSLVAGEEAHQGNDGRFGEVDECFMRRGIAGDVNISISGDIPSGLQLEHTDGVWDYKLVGTPSINSVGVYPLVITLSYQSQSITDEFTLTILSATSSGTSTSTLDTSTSSSTSDTATSTTTTNTTDTSTSTGGGGNNSGTTSNTSGTNSSTSNTSTPTNDNTSPTIQLNGSSQISLTEGDNYTELGSTASDNIDGDLTGSITISGTIDTSQTGTFTLYYNVSDSSGNSSSVSRTIIINEAPKTYVPDNAFEQFLIDSGYDDQLDDYVITSNISGITVLDIDRKQISDLTGIEDFTALQELRAEVNNLTNLDLSNNASLILLDVDRNNLSCIELNDNVYNNILPNLRASGVHWSRVCCNQDYNSIIYNVDCSNPNMNNIIYVTSNSDSDYSILGKDSTGDVDGLDPTLNFKVGDAIYFYIDADGNGNRHYFHIKTAPTTGQGDQISIPSGTYLGNVIWKPDTAGTYYYQCRDHNGHGGQIIISD